MTRRTLFIGLWLAGVLAALGLFYGLFSRYRALEVVNRELRSIVSQTSASGADTRIREEELRTEAMFVGQEVLVRDEAGRRLRLADVLQEGGCVVFVYSRYQCGACVAEQMRLMKECLKLEPKRVIIVSDYFTGKEMSVFRDLYKVEGLIFALESDWDISIDKLEMPYFMVFPDSGGLIERVFVPRKENPELSKAFFEMLNRSLIKSN